MLAMVASGVIMDSCNNAWLIKRVYIMTHLAQFKEGHAYISGEFGESMARRYFGDEVVDSMPR